MTRDGPIIESTPTASRSALAFFGDYVPRRCGIATFTADLCEAIAHESGDRYDVFAVAVNDAPEGYPYDSRVRFEVREAVTADYRLAADYLNIHQVSAVCVQHEYGIYGGPWGSYVLSLLRHLRRPVVTTLHTVLKDPASDQMSALKAVARASARLVVMSDVAGEILRESYGVPQEKLVKIPHGIPDVPFVDPSFYKDQFAAEGRKVLLIFGLLGPGKGLEYVINAMPAIRRKHPEVVYFILGATHPHVKRASGEEYRNVLQRRVRELNLEEHVIFHNRFVELRELCEYLGAADIYITPYLGEAQITSGTLAYAMGAGKAVISTPYWYAKEMLAEGRGRLVPFQNPEAIAEQVIDLLDNESERHAMRKRAYMYCRSMVWSQVGREYLDLLMAAAQTPVQSARPAADSSGHRIDKAVELPEPDLRHLRVMTDETGLLQHCLYATPNRHHGYCTDDNARALVAVALYWAKTQDGDALQMMQTYLAFLAHALGEDTRRFRNFLSYERRWTEEVGSEDSQGRALWGLGAAVARGPNEPVIGMCARLFRQALPAMENLTSPRAVAFAIIGIHDYLRRFSGDSEARRRRAALTDRLMDQFVRNASDDWPWCENIVSYANAHLPEALLMSGKWMQRSDAVEMGLRSLDWLLRMQTGPEGVLSLIGSNGWYTRDGKRARFDQQPVDAMALVSACIEAYHVTGDARWADEAQRTFRWFLGENDLHRPLYDFTTGGCRDGLHEDRVNENQGAESTLAWLLSLLAMHELQAELNIGETPPNTTSLLVPTPPSERSATP